VRVSGFTFLRNGTRLGYPYVESLRSLLPVVDELVVNVGRGDDDTLERVRALAAEESKIRIIESTWNERMEQRGFVYAQQKMIAQFNCGGDWAFYLEGDEVLHENDHPAIRAAMEQHLGDPRVEALAFDYLHFYGTPGQVAVSPAWYRRETRIIRNTIRSYAPDGQYWVVMDHRRKGRVPRAALANARVFHYGHVRRCERMQAKLAQVGKYWSQAAPSRAHDYGEIDPRALRAFEGTHPAVVRPWLEREAEVAFQPAPDYRPSRRELKHRWSMRLEELLGTDLSKKNFRLVR
jgi:hypothetical protein